MNELIDALRYCADHDGCDYYIAKDCPRGDTWVCGADCEQILMRDAADALEAADKRIDGLQKLVDINTERCEALRKQLRDSHESYEKHLNEIESQVPRWIPVTERLPERPDEVLIAYREEYDDWTEEYAVSTATYMPRAGRWDYDHLKITHWMPLPKAPDLT